MIGDGWILLGEGGQARPDRHKFESAFIWSGWSITLFFVYAYI